MIILPGPVVLRDPLPAGWRRCSSLGCGAPAGHDGEHVPEVVPPRPVAPAGRWVRRCTARSDCGRPAGHAPPCVPTRSDCTCGPYDPESRCTWCDGLVWQAAAVAVAGPEVDVGAELSATVSAAAPGLSATLAAVAAAVDRASRSLDAVPMPCAETMLAIDALESAEALVADLRIPDVIDVEALADTWPAQWRSLVEADPATLTGGGRRRRAAMIAIAEHVRGEQSTRAERIEAAARRLVRAQETTYAIEATCGLGEQRSDALRVEARAFDELRAALCTCTAHGPDPACVEHGEALRAWQARHAP